MGYADARCGRPAEATRLVRELEANSSAGDAAYVKIAAIYTSLGDRDAASYIAPPRSADLPLSFVKTHPLFELLHGDARYAPLLGRIGLQP